MTPTLKSRPKKPAPVDAIDAASMALAEARETVGEIAGRLTSLNHKAGLLQQQYQKAEQARATLIQAGANGNNVAAKLAPVRSELQTLGAELGELAEMRSHLEGEARAAQALLAEAERQEKRARADEMLKEADTLRLSLNNAGQEYQRRWRLLNDKYAEVAALGGGFPDDLDKARFELRNRTLTWVPSNNEYPSMPIVGEPRYL
jgi:chromosome segregation ATPase